MCCYTLTTYALLSAWLPGVGEGWLEAAHSLHAQKIITLVYPHPKARGLPGVGPVCKWPVVSLCIPTDTLQSALGDDPFGKKLAGV